MSAVHVRPFILKATNNAGVLEVTAEEESEILGSLSWSEFSGFDVSSYVGKKITSINGVGIEEWLQALGDRFCFFVFVSIAKRNQELILRAVMQVRKIQRCW
jgi:hypothetical protein